MHSYSMKINIRMFHSITFLCYVFVLKQSLLLNLELFQLDWMANKASEYTYLLPKSMGYRHRLPCQGFFCWCWCCLNVDSRGSEFRSSGLYSKHFIHRSIALTQFIEISILSISHLGLHVFLLCIAVIKDWAFWIKMVPIGSYIWMLSHQEVGLLEKD